jgi:hypothetical protein
LTFCAVVGLGTLINKGKLQYLKQLRLFASDSRWRIRESVASEVAHYGVNYYWALLMVLLYLLVFGVDLVAASLLLKRKRVGLAAVTFDTQPKTLAEQQT